MKNPAIHIKKKLFSLLNGAITYNSQPVHVEEGNGKAGKPYQVLIREYSDADAKNFTNFRYTGSQVIEVVNERQDEASKDADAIAGMVMNLLQPTVTDVETLSGDEFQVFIVGTPSKNILREQPGTGTIVRRILRYNLHIVER